MRLLHVIFSSLFLAVLGLAGGLVEKVCIVGCGVTGLTLANSLQRLVPDIKEIAICDARNNPLQPQIGGGLQVTSGAKVLEKLGMLSSLQRISNPFNGVLCRDNQLSELFRLSIDDLKKKRQYKDLITVSVMRDALLQMLYDSTSDKNTRTSAKPRINFFNNFQAEKVTEDYSAKKVSVEFSNGKTLNDFDLVVGADGVNSAICSYINPKKNLGRIDEENSKTLFNSPSIRILYCVTGPDKQNSIRPDASDTFHQYMGKGSYVLVSSYGTKSEALQHMLVLVYTSSLTKSDELITENGDWLSSPKSTRLNFLKEKLNQGGFESAAKGGEIEKILKATESDGRVFDLAVRDRLIPLSTWSSSSGRVVLAGDSAHPMAPFLGQGANQGMQDALSIALAVQKYNQKDTGSLGKYMKDYGRKRKNVTALLSLKAKLLGTIETLPGNSGLSAKNLFFKTVYGLGVIEKEFTQGAMLQI